jgi:hypothetical protein
VKFNLPIVAGAVRMAMAAVRLDALQSLDAGQSADTVTYAFKRRQRRDDGATGKAVDAAGQTNGDVGSGAFG